MNDFWIWAGIAGVVLVVVFGLLWFRGRTDSKLGHSTDSESVKCRVEVVSVKVPAMFAEENPSKQQILADSANAGRPLSGVVDGSGNLFYEMGVSGCKEIVPLDPHDKALLVNAQGCTMNSCTLPSGLKTPPAEPGKVWKVMGNRLVLTEQNEQDPE